MSIWKSLGLVEETSETPKKDTKKPIVKDTIAQPTPITNNYSGITASGNTEFDSVLEDAMEKENLPGPDFREFHKVLKNTENQAIPVQQKYILAFSGLQVMGLTKEKIIETSGTYLKALDKEEQEFNGAMTESTELNVTKNTQESERLSQRNIELQREIQDNMNKISELNIAAATNSQKIETKKQQFTVAIARAREAINTIVNNVKTML